MKKRQYYIFDVTETINDAYETICNTIYDFSKIVKNRFEIESKLDDIYIDAELDDTDIDVSQEIMLELLMIKMLGQ